MYTVESSFTMPISPMDALKSIHNKLRLRGTIRASSLIVRKLSQAMPITIEAEVSKIWTQRHEKAVNCKMCVCYETRCHIWEPVCVNQKVHKRWRAHDQGSRNKLVRNCPKIFDKSAQIDTLVRKTSTHPHTFPNFGSMLDQATFFLSFSLNLTSLGAVFHNFLLP